MCPSRFRFFAGTTALVLTGGLPASGQGAGADSITIRIRELDVRTAVQSLAQYLDRPVVFGQLNAAKVSLETPRPVARAQVYQFIRGMLDSQGMEIQPDSSGLYRVRMKDAKPSPPPTTPVVESARTQLAQVGLTALYNIHLSHARASEVAATVNALYGRGSVTYGEYGSRQGTLQQQIAQYQNPPQNAAPATGASTSGPSRGTSPLSAEATIIPDASTNSLLIRATRQDYELISAAVKELDVRPLQVMIEVRIAEVRRDRSLAFGVDVRLGDTPMKGLEPSTISGTNTGLGLGDFAVKVMGFRQYDIDATLRAAASRGDARIMSRPLLVAANNEDAEILVGSQRPFVQVSRSLPTSTPTRDQVVQYKDVGTRLSVRPTVSADGYVMLQVTQEVNQATAETQFDAPVISTRSVQTRLLIKNGRTVVLGGLTDSQKESHQSGIPFLSSIPLIGGLFGQATRATVETELFIFLTPRVLATDADAEQATAPLESRAKKGAP